MNRRPRAVARNRVLRFVVPVIVAVSFLLPRPGFGAGAGEPGGGDDQQRPKIGLVLSGGGARGLAHVGVLQWFEENRIPVGLVAGTSMGGLVGGIYASGADTGEMIDLLDSIRWAEVLRSDVPYSARAFRRKEDARQAPTTFEFGLNDGFTLPDGIDSGHQVGLILDRIAFPYSDIESFDDMPTPFACVAVDIESGQQVTFRGGGLAEALRATMSYPVWFAPVRSGDRTLIDGGVLNNLPTDVAVEMGADVVIAVDLGISPTSDEPFDSVVAVLNRTLSVMARVNTDRNAVLADVLITPDVSGFDFVDFAATEELIQIGYEATRAQAEALLRYRVDERAWAAYLAARRSLRLAFGSRPDFIDVEGAIEEDTPVIAETLAGHIGGDLDPDRLDADLSRVAGWGRYDVVGYSERHRNGESGLAIDVKEKTYGPPFLRPILDMRGSEFGEMTVALGGRFTFYDVAGTNSEWRTDATYGQQTAVVTELFVPFGRSGFFVAPHGIAGTIDQALYTDGEAVAQFQVERFGGGADFGYLFGPRSQLRFGVDLEYQTAVVKVGDPLLDPVRGAAGAMRAQWIFDGVNAPQVPTGGIRVVSEASWVFANPESDGDFYQAELELLAARPLTGRFSLLGSVQGGTTFDRTAPPLRQFVLGGPLQLGALGVDELRGSRYVLGRAGALWSLTDERRSWFFGKFYLAAFYEVGDAFEDRADLFHDTSFGLVGETLLGAVFVGGAVGQEGRRGFFFRVGRLF